jgi:hypothetical protein
MVDMTGVPEYEKWVPVTLKILGQKTVERKKDGKKFVILECEHENGAHVSLFDWALRGSNGKFECLQDHYLKAIKEGQAELGK